MTTAFNLFLLALWIAFGSVEVESIGWNYSAICDLTDRSQNCGLKECNQSAVFGTDNQVTLDNKQQQQPQFGRMNNNNEQTTPFWIIVSSVIVAIIIKSNTKTVIIVFASLMTCTQSITFEQSDYSSPWSNYGAAYGTTSNGIVYMIGGGDTSTTVQKVLKWNPKADPYEFIVVGNTGLSVDIACYVQCGALVQGFDGHEYLFVIGSYYSEQVFIFNTTSEKFVENNIIPRSTIEGCVSTDGTDNIYYSGGMVDWLGFTQMSVLDVSYSITSATWISLLNSNIGRARQYCFYYNGIHYDFEGFQSDSYHPWKYNVELNTWTVLNYTFDTKGWNGRAIWVETDKVAYLIGGNDASITSVSGLKRTFIFDPISESMTEEYNLQTARLGHSLVVVEDTLYAIAGYIPMTSIEHATITSFDPTISPTNDAIVPTFEPTNLPTFDPTLSPASVSITTSGYEENESTDKASTKLGNQTTPGYSKNNNDSTSDMNYVILFVSLSVVILALFVSFMYYYCVHSKKRRIPKGHVIVNDVEMIDTKLTIEEKIDEGLIVSGESEELETQWH